MPNSFTKDPQAKLDYRFDWSKWLSGGETISASTITATSGITVESQTNDTTTATIWLSGGTVGKTYTLTNHITTSAGRQDDRTATVQIREK